MKKVVVCFLILVIAGLLMAGCGQSEESAYQKGIKLIAEEKYSEAIIQFEKASDFEDSSKYILYARALQEAEIGNYYDALTTLDSLKDFADAGFFKTYYEAKQLCEEGDMMSAKSLYESIPLFKDSKNKAAEVAELLEKRLQVGYVTEFGHYEQDNDKSNGMEPIQWRVLALEEGKALVISVKTLDAMYFNDVYDQNITWEECTLRKWLNRDFFWMAFSDSEEERIITTEVVNTDGGYNTQDKVFLLSLSEADRYFSSDKDRMCAPTDYAFAQARSDSWWMRQSPCFWWLRSPGTCDAKGKTTKGLPCTFDHVDGKMYAIASDQGIRPAMWITRGD